MPTGTHGPNDNGYINRCARKAAETIRMATYLWCEGHYPHSNARIIPEDHPLVKALEALAQIDKDTARFANLEHDPSLFLPHRPTEEALIRWEKEVSYEK